MRILAVMFFLMLIAAGCGEKTVKQGKSIEDDLGYKFEFENVPKRVISLAPSITESMFFLGLDSTLAGVTQYCDFPEEAKRKKSVGGMLDPNLEIITQINPDIIFLTTEGNSQVTYKSLKELGFRVFVLNPKNVQGIVNSLEKLNMIFRSPESDKQLNAFKTELDSVSNAPKSVSGSEGKQYAAFLALKPLISFNKNTFLHDIFARSGFKNLYAEEKLDYPTIAEEDLFAKDPEYVFVFSVKEKEELVRKELEQSFGRLRAVRNKKYMILDENLFTRPGPRVVNSIKILKEQ